MSNKKGSFFGLGVALGAVVGSLAGFFLSPKSGKENREEAMKKFNQLKKLLEDRQLDDKIKEIFGEATEEAKKKYLEVKEQVIMSLSELKGKISEIDKEKYVKTVEDVTKELRKEAKFTGKVIDKLRENLIADWKKIKS